MMQQAKSEFSLPAFLDKHDKYQVLILDDLGYVKKTEQETQVLFDLIAHRYESGSLIITSNQVFSQWEHIFGDTCILQLKMGPPLQLKKGPPKM